MPTVKSGYLRKHSKSIISGGWNQVWVVLHDDSNLVVYKKQGDSSPMGTINLFDVRKWFAYGEYASDMPDRPSLPPGATIKQLMAIPQKPSSKAKIHWFLADTEADLHGWMEAICKVLPPPPQETTVDHRQQTGTHLPSAHQQPLSSAPPPYPGGPPPTLGFDAVAAGMPMPSPVHATSYPQQAHFPQQQPHFQPPPASYPQQNMGYPQQNMGYPQQNMGYPQQNMGYPQQAFGPPPPHGVPAAYPQQQYYQPQGVTGGYYQQAPGAVVYQQSPHKKGFLSGGKKNAALGVLGGAALAYGASRMMGGGLFGWGRRGSWSSLDSWGSGGSIGSFGSFG